jgi:hypothetical protein
MFDAAGFSAGLRGTVDPAGGSHLTLLRPREVRMAPNEPRQLTASSLRSCLAVASGCVRLTALGCFRS